MSFCRLILIPPKRHENEIQKSKNDFSHGEQSENSPLENFIFKRMRPFIKFIIIKTMVPADQFPEGWPCCNPSFVLEALHELEKEKCPQEKRFYSTYPTKWEKLDVEKRQKTFIFFSKLDLSVKTSASAKATEKEKASSGAAKAENNVTTKRDKSRMLC